MRGAADRVMRWLRGTASGRASGAFLGASYLRLCWATTTWTVEGAEHRDALVAEGPFIAALWHGRLAFSPFLPPKGSRAVAMISNNHDGDLITALVARFGVEAVRGSSADPRKAEKDKGGKAAFEAGRAALEAGALLAMTPDGPRGPRMRAQVGVAALSTVMAVPVLPVAISTARGRLLKSWDRFLLPKPFDRGALLIGEPIRPPAQDNPVTIAEHRHRIETALNALTARADETVGRDPVAPGPT